MTRFPISPHEQPRAGGSLSAPASYSPLATLGPRSPRTGAFDETIAYAEPGRFPEDTDDPTHDEDVEDLRLVGETLGHYRLDAFVGKGSMGRVYRAHHLGLHRTCAIKVMHPALIIREPQVRERFWAEARAVANLLHPHVVTIHNLGCERGYHFIEMEYVSGGVSLREQIIREGPLESVRAATLVWQIAQALQAAHTAGLVHRDVKPANVLLNDQGLAKLADFGLVRRISELEQAGVPIAGTPTYMAPELFEGVPASHRSDLYAVGVMLYYLLSARLPFTSDQISRLVLKHRNEPIPDIRLVVPTVPDAFRPILARCLAKRPEDRYESASELADDLATLVSRIRDTESLVRESVEGLDCFVQGGRDNFRILFPLPGDRLQEVYVEVTESAGGERLLSVFSVCAPAEPGHFEFALRLNDRLTYGSLSVRDVQGRAMFVMNRTYSRDHVCPADIRAAMLEIARRSDRVEHQLTDADLY
jgi:eukaryotic-like serine/threonine-protein kinase